MRIRAIGGALVAFVILVAAWVLVAPRELGGPVSYVVVFGTSMEPSLHAGDLVGVREKADYQVGDIVAYDNKDIGQIVLHRIIRHAGDRYVFQGDNNDFIDPYRPVEGELLGKEWFRVAGAGAVLKRLQAPLPAGILAGVVGLIAAGGVGANRAHKGGMQPMTDIRRPHGASEGPRRPVAPKMLTAGLALGVLLLGAATAFVFSHPESELSSTRTRYAHIGELSYSAPAPAGPVYEEDVTTGDPVFLNVLTEIEVALDYRFETDAEHSVEGTGSIEARLTGPNGWRRTWQVTDEIQIGDATRLTGTVDLKELRRSILQVEQVTGVEQQAYEVDLVAPLTIEGTVSGAEIEETFAPNIRFVLDEQQLQLQQSADAEVPPAGTPVTTRKTESLTIAAPVPAQLELMGRALDLDVARIVAPAALGVCLLALLVTGIPWIRALRRDEPSRIRARYGSQLVSARVVDLSRGHSRVEVESMEALARIAERFDLPILCDDSGSTYRYIVEGGAAVYVYASAAAASTSEELVDEEAGSEPVL